MQMKIRQILNNNVALVKRGKNEVIIYAKGISFRKKAGDMISDSEVEKTYVLDSNEMLEHFSYLLKNTDERIIILVNKIIAHGEKQLNQAANDYLSLTLLDHIDYALKRAGKGQFIQSPLTLEVKKFYPKQFEIGLYAIRCINEAYDAGFPDDEAVSIALHFVNLQETQNNLEATLKTMESLKDIIRIIQLHFAVSIDESSFDYMRLMTHLQYFLRRIDRGDIYDDGDLTLNAQIRKLYTEAYHCTQKIKIYIRKKYNCEITVDEETYLMIHIQRVTGRKERKTQT